MPNQRSITCGYCGEPCTNGTRDHIVPRNLWGNQRLPDNLATVAACPKCHAELDRDAEYFRNVVIALAGDGEHPIASSVLHGTMTRSFKRSPAKLASIALGMKLKPRFTETGLYTGSDWTFRLDLDRFNAYIKKIILGLYAYKSSTILPKEYEVTVYRGNGFWGDIRFKKLIERMGPWEHFRDDSVFAWKYVRDNQDKTTFACILSFYTKVAVFALVSRVDSAESDVGRISLIEQVPVLAASK